MKKKTAQPADCIDETVVHPALKAFFSYRFFKLAMRLRASVNEALCAHGLVAPQLGLLRVLDLSGPASQVDLGRDLGIDKASMVKWLDGLEKAGCLKRVADTKDRRIKRISLTPKGKAKLSLGAKLREGVEQQFFSPLTESEREALEKTLAKLLL